MTSTCVIIPALNEEGNIRRLVDEVINTPIPDTTVTVIVVDNGSTDETALEARSSGARVVSEARRGYGYACFAGLQAAQDADIVVFLDGDFSSLPSELPEVLAPILSGKFDLCLGSRKLGGIAPGAMPPHQRFGNQFAAWLLRMLYRLPVTDLGPYRAIRREALLELNMQEMTYGWPTEMMVKSARRGLRIAEVPVSFHRRQAGLSKVSGTVQGTLLAAWFILSVTLKYVFEQVDS